MPPMRQRKRRTSRPAACETNGPPRQRPVYFREPSVNLGIGPMEGKPPHLVGRAFLDRFWIKPDRAVGSSLTCAAYEEPAARSGTRGRFAELQAMTDRLRGGAGKGH